MGVQYNTSIVTSGLVLCLDAANYKSYDYRENLVAYSTYNASAWSNPLGATGTITTGISAPDGTNTAIRYTFSNTGNAILRVAIPAFTPNGTDTYTTSFYVRLISGTGTLSTDLTDGNPSKNYNSELITNQWVRIVTSGIPTATSKTFIDLISDTNTNYVLDFWGVQLEKSSTASTYTGTSGSTITRSTTWTDLSGNNRNGTLVNGVRFNSAQSGSLSFDGTDDHIDLSTPFFISTSSPFTINLWMKINIRAAGVGSNFYRMITLRASGTSTLGVAYSSTLSSGYEGIYMTNNNGWSRAKTGFHPTSDVWALLTLTYNGSGSTNIANFKIYWNLTELTFDTTGVTTPAVTTDNNYLGLRQVGDVQMYQGQMSSLYIYNKVLTTAELNQNFNALRGRYSI